MARTAKVSAALAPGKNFSTPNQQKTVPTDVRRTSGLLRREVPLGVPGEPVVQGAPQFR
ncbi:hypothetical protein AB0891_29805 [Streptomyces sp. NPDC007259]|uniref:hypothetical protein n=1 Tax=Streptomyces sp. NPDC007259 TaxID=3154319 RepID=UPI003453B1E8